MVRLAEVFARYGPAYLEKYGPNILPSHRRAIADILRCRTPELGGQVYCCDRCGHTHYVYHSCRNRSCPQCHYEQTRAWREARRRELLDVPYFHVVFTVPDTLHAALRRDQTRLYGILMQAAGQSLIELAGDPHYVGGTVGLLAVLHTWGRTLTYHPQVHGLVTGGGLDLKTREWRGAREDYLVPVKALSALFRRHFRELLGPTLQGLSIPASVWRAPWVVHCEPVRGGPESVLNYLAGYVYRTAISEERILAAGFHKVCYYGLWAPGYRPWRRRLQFLLGSGDPADTRPAKFPSPLRGQFNKALPPAGSPPREATSVRRRKNSIRLAGRS